MNRIYRTVWKAARGQWQVAPENVKRHDKSSVCRLHTVGAVASLAVGSILLLPLGALASGLPSGGEIRAGNGDVEQSGNEMRINQDSDRMAIDWDDFSVDEGSRVAFNQPGRDAAALNRVTGDQLSQIRGAIEANGQVFLVNPNGIVFGDTAQVDVGGLVASTLDISPDDFMAGDFTFEGDSSSAIINQGNIRAGDEGYVALIAAEIINEGNIKAPRGDVMMGAGSRVTLDMGGPIKIEVEEALLDTYIEQGGAIQADGGRVYLTAKAAGDLAASVINHTGTTQARTLAENEQGEIWLMGDMDNGETQVAGTLDASAPSSLNPSGGNGGFVETSAAKVSIMDEATVTTRADDGQTGEWLIDPQDYTVAEEDGDITGNTLSNNLADNNVTIESVDGGEDGNGDIFVNDEVTWESGNTLTLDAQRDITINEEVDASEGNSGKLSLEYGQDSTDGGSALFTANAPVNLQAGQNLSSQLGSGGEVLDFIVITELGDETGYDDDTLQAMRDDLEGHYALGADIDASDTANWDGGEGWEPIGTAGNSFRGSFDGLGHEISDLSLNRPTEDRVGLFGRSVRSSGDYVFKNLSLVNVDIIGSSYVGSLVGESRNGIIHNSEATGSVKSEGAISGGLVGSLASDSVLQDSHANVNVSGNDFVGGLVAGNVSGAIVRNSYATGKIEGNEFVGGLAGIVQADGSRIENSFATGDVNGESKVGGLAGRVGFSDPPSQSDVEISNSYATGKVTGNSSVGGLLGDINVQDDSIPKIENNFWDVETSGIGSAGDDNFGATGLTSAEIQQVSTFTDAGWDETTWSLGAGDSFSGYGLSRPYLTHITRDDDIPDQTPLFNNGFGTEDQPFTLTDWQQLQNINDNDDVLTGGYYYALENDLDANTAGYDDLASASANGDEGWNPIGDGSPPDNGPIFTGQFDGGNNTIGDLTIANDRDNLGLFGATTDASISNLILHNPDVSTTGFSYGVGALAGRIQDTTVDNVTVSGDQAEVKGYFETGGLIGSANESSINNSASAASVTGDPESFNAGGLVGYNDQTQIEDSSASGAVSGGAHVGGLAGLNTSDSLIRNSQSTGDVTIPDSANEGTRGYAGGFVGRNEGSIENASASGDVVGLIGDEFEGTDYLGIGSFAGDNAGLIHNADASGAVTVENATGNETQVAEGLLGRNTGLLANGYVTGSNTAYWRQHDNDMGIADQPDDLTLVDSAAIKARLENGIDVDLATTGDSASVDADIGSQGSVDLGDAEQHDAALSLDALNGISLMSEQALRLGNITAADAIAIATATGDLTLTDDITTEATSDQAVVLTAGDNEAPGTATGGDIRYASGDLTTGTGGGTLLYTGSLAGSEDIATLIAQGDFRYNSSATTANYTEALDAERHLIYREQPEVRVSADGKTITYGDDVPSDYDLQDTRGFVNGDDDSILSGTPTWSVEEALSSAGYQNAGDHRIEYDDGLSNALGYAIVTDTANTSTLTVDPLTLTAAEIGDGESVYGESLTPSDASLDGILTDDEVASTTELTDATRSRSDNVNVGTYDQQADTGTLTGTDAGNYTLDPFTQPDSYVVPPRPVTVTADDQRKTEGRSDPELTYQAENQQPERGLVDGDTLAGELERETGEDIGRYAIQQGGLDNTQNPNYAIDFIEGELAITTRPVPPTPEPQSELEPNANFDAVVNQTLQAASSSEQEEPMALRNESTNENLLPGGIEIVESGINFALNDDVEGDN